MGRDKKISIEDVQALKNQRLTQIQVSERLNVSLRTIKRYWHTKEPDANATRVLDYIKNNYDLAKVYLKALPVLSGGISLTDENGNTYLYYYADNQVVSISGECIGKGYLQKIGTMDLEVYGIDTK